ncbi:peptidylprolyl isomerase [Asticcacaulis sp. YBE204]|uniref:peptidylprolyl isomerase n=1 Tax=Asticcacaulis sp. YBE204 TaxID=1282363 RepID=UPI0003C3B8E8|nr:peptidylprolyl isomerase [Asticcacaulis sp. YBE204]ESQ81336.1 hypothetical protein AEYBE204_03060 [Asticcacaulis sp. YBE204]
MSDIERRGLIVTGAALVASALSGCEKPEPPKPAAKPAPPPAPPKPQADGSEGITSVKLPTPPDTVRVSLTTSMGEILFELDGKHAPISTANFLQYVNAGKFTDAEFWRAMKSGAADGGGFIQMSATGHKFPPIPHEATTKTGLSHTNGTLSTARYAVGTASNEFTISIGDMSYMDAGRDPSGDNLGYAAFGRVVSGMSIVRKILNGRISKVTKEGGWAGQMLEKPVKILSAKRLD